MNSKTNRIIFHTIRLQIYWRLHSFTKKYLFAFIRAHQQSSIYSTESHLPRERHSLPVVIGTQPHSLMPIQYIERLSDHSEYTKLFMPIIMREDNDVHEVLSPFLFLALTCLINVFSNQTPSRHQRISPTSPLKITARTKRVMATNEDYSPYAFR